MSSHHSCSVQRTSSVYLVACPCEQEEPWATIASSTNGPAIHCQSTLSSHGETKAAGTIFHLFLADSLLKALCFLNYYFLGVALALMVLCASEADSMGYCAPVMFPLPPPLPRCEWGPQKMFSVSDSWQKRKQGCSTARQLHPYPRLCHNCHVKKEITTKTAIAAGFH